MIRIHHATQARAAKFGITLNVSENEVEASKDGCILASAPQANVALDTAIAAIERSHNENDETFEGEGQDDAESVDASDIDETIEQAMAPTEGAEPKPSRSVIKPTFRDRYKEHGGNCGDDLAQLLSKHVTVSDNDGKSRVDMAKLKALVKLNGLEWKPEYDVLNPGLIRMTCANRLRALSRRGKTIIWN